MERRGHRVRPPGISGFRGRNGGGAGCARDWGAPVAGGWDCWSALRRVPTPLALGRCSGPLAIRSTRTGPNGPACCGAGRGRVRMAAHTAVSDDPSNGGRPSTAEYRVAPSAHRSPGASTAWPSSCSGGMYCGVPTSTAEAVSRKDASRMRAMPKSVITTRWPSRSTLSGLRSRCTIPAACAWASASAKAAPFPRPAPNPAFLCGQWSVQGSGRR